MITHGDADGSERDEAPDRFDYFMIRVRRRTGLSEAEISGVAERLATGEKQSFSTDRELLRFVGGAPPESNMPSGRDAGNRKSSRK